MILKHAISITIVIVLLSLGLVGTSLASHAQSPLPQLPPRYTPTPLPTTPPPTTSPPTEEPGPDAPDTGEGPTKTSPPTPTMVVLMPESGDAVGGAMPWEMMAGVVVGIGVIWAKIKIEQRKENLH
mgnify:CR=1 FL=1